MKVKVKRCRRESEERRHHEGFLEGGEDRVRRLSGMEAAGCVLSERHPVAAGLFNTSVFVIIPHKQRGECSLKVSLDNRIQQELERWRMIWFEQQTRRMRG